MSGKLGAINPYRGGSKICEPQIVGQTFGRWTVKSLVRIKSHWWGLCRCECGSERNVRADHLKRGVSKSCGCLAREATVVRNTKHGGCRRVVPRDAEYHGWVNMNQRCHNPKCENFSDYGARGITVCEEWRNSYAAFLAHIGRKPSPLHSVDRIDNNGNYEPGNVRWAIKQVQCNNRRSNRFVEYGGERRTLADWSRITGIGYGTIMRRLNVGWETGKALTQPV